MSAFKSLPPEAQAAIIAAGTAILTTILGFVFKSFIEKNVHLKKLENEYKYEQLRSLKTLLAKNKMRLLNAAEALNHRLWNFTENHSEGWMDSRGNYYKSFVYRFGSFFAYVRQIEKELIYIDSTFAKKEDLEFIKFLRMFPQLFTDVSLFNDHSYDKNHAIDHFFRNNFENIVEIFIRQNEIIPYCDFLEEEGKFEHEIPELFDFFDNLETTEERYRWDLLQHFHLSLIAFLNTYGYDFQKTTKKQIFQVLTIPRQSRLLLNYRELILRYKLDSNKWITKILYNKHIGL